MCLVFTTYSISGTPGISAALRWSTISNELEEESSLSDLVSIFWAENFWSASEESALHLKEIMTQQLIYAIKAKLEWIETKLTQQTRNICVGH